MSTIVKPREIRRLAFQWLYQLDATSGADREALRESVSPEATDGLDEREVRRAWDTACAAYDARATADELVTELAPTWPAHRQPAVDRAIFRLAHHEMTSGTANPKTIINEAVELAKKYSTERSPAFINGVLDKLLKRVRGEAVTPMEPETAETEGDA
ncbi:MAG: transcription antitermination factor NusB [Phycisphaerales bacterium]